MPSSKPPGHYAVAVGRHPGVYSTWDACEAEVRGIAGAKFKKFRSKDEAEAFVNGGRVIASSGSPSTSPAPSSVYSSPPRNHTSQNSAKPDPPGWTAIYTDGACKSNGKTDPVAGVGVWFGNGDPRNVAERCPGVQTNNRAELIAIIRALEMMPLDQKIIVKTDSEYSLQCIENWLPGWRFNNFRTAKGEPVKNLPLILYLSELLEAKVPETFKFEKVLAHSGIYGNECADYQANRGCEATWREEYPDEWDLKKVEKKKMAELEANRRRVASMASSTSTASSKGLDYDPNMFSADDLADDDELEAEISEYQSR